MRQGSLIQRLGAGHWALVLETNGIFLERRTRGAKGGATLVSRYFVDQRVTVARMEGLLGPNATRLKSWWTSRTKHVSRPRIAVLRKETRSPRPRQPRSVRVLKLMRPKLEVRPQQPPLSSTTKGLSWRSVTMSVRSLTTLVFQMRLLRRHAFERAAAGLIGILLESTAVTNTAEAASRRVLMIGLRSLENTTFSKRPHLWMVLTRT